MKEGRNFLYSARPSAYAMEPWESVNYADCHDGQTLFDQVFVQPLLVQLQQATVKNTDRFHKCFTMLKVEASAPACSACMGAPSQFN